MSDPRYAEDYTARQTEAAHRVLVDVQQVLAGFRESIVLVGGWVPDLLFPEASEPHVGSIDVDLALDTARLSDGRYAELLKLLGDTGRYRPGPKAFQLQSDVPLPDGGKPVTVDVDFLAPRTARLRGKGRMKGFRILQADGCAAAFRAPAIIEVSGPMIDGVKNTVQVRVASLPDFLVMKCHALAGRDKPKDAYDIVYCLDQAAGELDSLAAVWADQRDDQEVREAIRILREKFSAIDSYGPQRSVQFRNLSSGEETEIAVRRAYELVQRFLVACQTKS